MHKARFGETLIVEFLFLAAECNPNSSKGNVVSSNGTDFHHGNLFCFGDTVGDPLEMMAVKNMNRKIVICI